jgi:dCMP deaminase
VKGRMIISDGFNGTPTGFENPCEEDAGDTKWYVLHAEANAILKVANSTQSCAGATLYLTLSPCRDCSKLIHQSGIVRVVYADNYKDTTGLDFLAKAGVELHHLPFEEHDSLGE